MLAGASHEDDTSSGSGFPLGAGIGLLVLFSAGVNLGLVNWSTVDRLLGRPSAAGSGNRGNEEKAERNARAALEYGGRRDSPEKKGNDNTKQAISAMNAKNQVRSFSEKKKKSDERRLRYRSLGGTDLDEIRQMGESGTRRAYSPGISQSNMDRAAGGGSGRRLAMYKL